MSHRPPEHLKSSPLPARNTIWVIAYQRYFRLWINLAKTTGISDEEAKDLVHGVISSILTDSLKEFESLEHLRNYVGKAVLNRAIQAKQKSIRREPWTERIDLQFALWADTLESEEHQMLGAMREGIEQLGAHEYEIIRLRFYFGLTFREISEKLDVPISTLKSREDAAIKKIRKYLRKNGF